MTDFSVDSPGPNARVYWEMYGGLPIDNQSMDAHVVGVRLVVEIGGTKAKAGILDYQVSLFCLHGFYPG